MYSFKPTSAAASTMSTTEIGTIVGAVVGAVLVLVALFYVVRCCRNRGSRGGNDNRSLYTASSGSGSSWKGRSQSAVPANNDRKYFRNNQKNRNEGGGFSDSIGLFEDSDM